MTLFQELILISLGKQDQFSRKLTDEDWFSLYNEAQRQYLVGILLTGVEKDFQYPTVSKSIIKIRPKRNMRRYKRI